MDIISFNEASTANGRIESFIENPDSMSGIVTVPKVIASGETITIPAGRIAVLPNVQVDGTLNIEGDVFIPSGSTYDNVIDHSTLPTATTELVSTDFVVVLDDTVPKKITLTDFTQELTSATVSQKGIVELASNLETITGIDTARAITPAGLMNAFNKTGSAPMFACRAWVSFKGTGTVTINKGGNTSSITDNAVGDYTMNFTTAMPDALYALAGSAIVDATEIADLVAIKLATASTYANKTTSGVTFRVGNNNVDSAIDAFDINVFIID